MIGRLKSTRRWAPFWALVAGAVWTAGAAESAAAPPSPEAPFGAQGLTQFIETHCLDCHDGGTKEGGLALDRFDAAPVGQNSEVWEKVVRKLTARHMPPKDAPRPDEESYRAAIAWLEESLDRAAAEHPRPGRTETFRRLNRTEYQNAIRDLLALEVDGAALLPPDESSHGFDNVTVADLSPTLLNRYVSAAQKISWLAVGRSGRTPEGDTFRIRPDITQDAHVAGLPLGTRGGALFPYYFPQSGEYEIQIRLMRDRNEEIEGLTESHELEVLLDRERVAHFTIKPPPKGQSDAVVDANLTARIQATAGPHDLGVTFVKMPSSLLEIRRQPLNVHFNYHRHPRLGPAVYQMSITGPFQNGVQSESSAAATSPDTPSRRRIFNCTPNGSAEEEDCARRILAQLMRRAYRRPVDAEDLDLPMEFFHQGRAEGGFEAGVEHALSSVLVSPHFLFRIERDPAQGDVADPEVAAEEAAAPYRIRDVELASRLSFFLWSSIPDDELLDLAIRDELSRPEVLEQQTRRLLADPRSRSLVTNFADQWLYLRNLESITPDARLFPDFDDNLRQAFRQETELFFESILREDRSVLDLLQADYTFLNERLAKHYGIPHVYGSRFRRVAVDEPSRRGGLLRHGSILTVTSYATRTSPVIRGHWVLKNLLGEAPPPPPPNVPALEDNTVSGSLSIRDRLAQHRANPACSGCHELMDPVGFALENYDAVGRWREVEGDKPIDAAGSLPDGSEFTGVEGLEQALRDRPELFVRTLAEKLLTFALGRGIELDDAPAIRQVVREAKDEDYRFSSLIVGIVRSTPFQMREVKESK
jgi:hypothetical protein